MPYRFNILCVTFATGIAFHVGGSAFADAQRPAAGNSSYRNVRSCGAALDGHADDTSAFQQCLDDLEAGGVLFVPPGQVRISRPLHVADGPVVFDLAGDTYANSTVPVGSLVTNNLFESLVGPTRWLSLANDATHASSTLRVDGAFLPPAKPEPGRIAVVGALETNCVIPAARLGHAGSTDYVWCNRTVAIDGHDGTGQDVALSASMFRPATSLQDRRGPRGPVWAGYWEANDQTDAASDRAGPVVGVEGDLYANNDDPGSNDDGGDRIDLHLVVGRSDPAGPAARVGHMIELGTNEAASATPSYFGVGLDFGASRWDEAAIDTSRAHPLVTMLRTSASQAMPAARVSFTPPLVGLRPGMMVGGPGVASGTRLKSMDRTTGVATMTRSTMRALEAGTGITFTSDAPALRLGEGQRIEFGGSVSHSLAYADGALTYRVGGVDRLRIGDDGAVMISPARTTTPHGAGRVPELRACGNAPELSGTATDRHGTIMTGSGATRCGIRFAVAYRTAPDCVLTGWDAKAPPFLISVSNSEMAIGVQGSRRFTYLCE